MSGQVLEPESSMECRAWADEMARQAAMYAEHGHPREAADCRHYAARWTRSAERAAEREGALW